MQTNPLLGILLVEMKALNCAVAASKGCLLILFAPFLCSIFALIGGATNDDLDSTTKMWLIIGCVLVVLSFPLIAFLFYKFSNSNWLKNRRNKMILKVYQNGFELIHPDSTVENCLWSEIKNVNPLVLKSHIKNPEKFAESPVDTKCFGVYEIYKKDGGKILLNRWFDGIEKIDPNLIHFCKVKPIWKVNEID